MSLKYQAISVVIPTINRKVDLINTIQNLKSQKKVDFEVIIIDQSEMQSLSKIEIDSFSINVHYFTSKEKNASYSRNIGLRKAKYDIVLFLDDDVIINDELFLFQHLINYNDPAIQGVFGQILLQNQKPTSVRPHISKNKKCGWMFFPPNYNARTELFGIGMAGNLSIMKELAIAVGGMDENYIKGAYREESDFTFRYYICGYKIIFDPSCSLIHIGSEVGGIRSWAKGSSLKAFHHCVSEIYFTRKYYKNIGLIPSVYSILRRQIFNRPVLLSPFDIYLATKQLIASYFASTKLLNQKSALINNEKFYDEEVEKIQ